MRLKAKTDSTLTIKSWPRTVSQVSSSQRMASSFLPDFEEVMSSHLETLGWVFA